MQDQPDTADAKAKVSRRKFLRRAACGLAGAGLAAAYPFVEARWYGITRRRIAVPNLPPAFAGATIALLADIHHGPKFGLGFVRSVVEDTNALGADLVALVGDYVHRAARYIGPCIAELARLRAPLGVYAVLGNHDHWERARETRAALARAGIRELRNAGSWLARGPGARLWLCGVDDLWAGSPDLAAALADCPEDQSAILLCHNPDFVEGIRDRRVGLVLSGHTHGGQVQIPFVGAPIVPSKYGQKYLQGLVKTAYTQVYVSRGLGTITPAVRFNCRPEIVRIELQQG